MIRKRYDHEDFHTRGTLQLTDEHDGSGSLHLEGIGPARWVQDPPRPHVQYGYNYGGGHNEWDAYRVVGKANPREYENSFGLKLYDEGYILPSSIAGATVFSTKAEAAALVVKWLSEGGPGLALESAAETTRMKRAERSAYALTKITRSLSGLTDEDLTKLSEAALRQITKREENASKEAAKAEAKRLKAAEKARAAAEKEAKKQAAAAKKQAAADAKAAKAAEKARKQAERLAPSLVA